MSLADDEQFAGAEEWQWLVQVGEGDELAFARLVECHQDRIVRLCFRLLGRRALAEEAAQEVFLKLYWQSATLVRRGQLSTWLYRVASNYCLNRLRRRKIARFLPLARSDQDGEESWQLEPEDRGPDAERTLEARRDW